MYTMYARVEFNTPDGVVIIPRFPYGETEDIFSIIHNCYASVSRVYPDAQMVSFMTIN